MKVLFVLPRFLPAAGMTGSMLFAYSLLESLRATGNAVAVFAYDLERREGYDPEPHRRELVHLGVPVHTTEPSRTWREALKSPLGRAARNGVYALLPDERSIVPFGRELERDLRRVIDAERPDVVWSYMLAPTLVAGRMSNRPPLVASVVDLEWKARAHALQAAPSGGVAATAKRLIASKSVRWLQRREPQLLSRADVVLSHGATASAWYAQNGLDAPYVPVPVRDSIGQKWREARERTRSTSFTVGHVGRIDGLHTGFALTFLQDELLPLLAARPPTENAPFTIEIVGGGRASLRHDALFSHPNVVKRGFVDDIGAELSRFDALVVPVDVDLGFRVRIAEAFAYGTPVVAHRLACVGMPEVESGKNALLADDARQMAEALRAIASDPSLSRRLSEAARATFERHYDARVVADRMEQEMRRAVALRPAKRTETANEVPK